MSPSADLGERSLITDAVHRRPAVGLAIGIVRNGQSTRFHAHGFADIASRTPVTEDTVFRIGSITKTFTAIAVAQLGEHGKIDLDAPVCDYLRAYDLVPAKAAHPPPTVRQLLTHTSGLPELVRPSRAFSPVLGETVASGQRVPPLAEFYRGRLRLVAEPGTTHTYSNHGFATLGQLVEDVTGRALADHLRDHLFAPLGMTHTSLAPTGRAGAATGYVLRSGGPRPVEDRELVTAGAGGVRSTIRDLCRYVAALLGGSGTILRAGTLATVFAPHYRPDPRLPGMGLGFFRRDLGGHLVVEHDGLMPGFTSHLAVAPGDDVGVVAFTNGAYGARTWLSAEVGEILREVLGVPAPGIRTGVPHHPELWTDLCGWYSFRGSARDVPKWFVAGAKVTVRRGRLVLHALTPIPALARGLVLHPDDPGDPYAFRVDLSALDLGTSRLVFSRSPAGGVDAFHFEFAPLSFDKRR